MTAILEALSALNQSLSNLESTAVSQVQNAKKQPQRDLFGGLDPALLAKKLDVTIERVEQVLREG